MSKTYNFRSIFLHFKSHCEMNEVREEDESDDGGDDLSGVVVKTKNV